MKLLIVDDLEANLRLLETVLKRDDLEILRALSGREALELLLVHDVALALIDVQMPDMDGFDLAELMRGTEKTRHVPIIFLTAGAQESHRIFQGYDAGAVDFLFKPIEPRILRHKTDTFFQVLRQRQALAETLRLNEELMAVVGHDLRNPLNVILMTASLLAERAKDPETEKIARRLRTSGTRMVQIIEELFDLSRARLGGGIPIQRQPTNAFDLAQNTIAEFEATNPTRTIELHHDGDLRGEWDQARIEQILSNLIGNAVRHGSSGQPILVRLAGVDSDVVISVHNVGHVSAELLPRLFDPFQSGDGKRARADGLGLGLYIVQQLALSHGGSVEVHSDPDQGTTFSVRLPRK